MNPPLRLPAEWEPHEATLIGWPHHSDDWPGKMEAVQWVYAEIVRKIAPFEKVRIVVENGQHKNYATKYLKNSDVDLNQIEFFLFPTDRGWMRDSGPITLKAGTQKRIAGFRFNAWAKYSNWKKDDQLINLISEKLTIDLVDVRYKDTHVVLEGGAIDPNGADTLLTTEECLLDSEVQVRNPGFTKSDYEEVFKAHLGTKKVIWLAKSIAGDDTHGHVDDICRFVNEKTVVLVQEEDEKDDNYLPLKENLERLKGMKLADGSNLNLVTLPMPSPLYFEGIRLPASYANFYISNGAVLVPTFNDPMDRKALGILAELITDRPVVGIHAVDLVWGFGTLHCLTHDQPA